jgi:hypothetical protein
MHHSLSSLARLGPRVRWPSLVALAALVIYVAVYLPFRTLVPPSGDFMLNVWNPGQALLSHRELDSFYPYPLWTPVLLLPIATLPAPVAAAIWFAINLGLTALCAVLLLDFAGWPRRIPVIVALSLLIGSYDPVFTAFWLGQIVFLSLALALGLLRALRGGRWALAGVLLGVSCLKPQALALVTLGVFAVALYERRWVLFAGFAAPVAALVVLALPFAATPRELLGRGVGAHLEAFIARSSTLWGLSLWLLPGQFLLPALGAAALVIWLAAVWLRVLREGAWRERLGYLLSVTVVVSSIALPYNWPYSNALFLLPLCYSFAAALRMRGVERVLWAALLLGVAFPCTQFIYAALVGPYHSEVFQVIPSLLLLPLIVAIEHRSGQNVRVPDVSGETPVNAVSG